MNKFVSGIVISAMLLSSANAYAWGGVIGRAQMCESLRQAVENAKQNLNNCITSCRKTLEGTTPPTDPETIKKICGVIVPTTDPIVGSQCQAAYLTLRNAKLNYSQCNSRPEVNPLIPQTGVLEQELEMQVK